jgi:hypothetical protein
MGFSWAPVAHTHNPSYSGGRDQEDCNSKTAWANSSQDLVLKKTHHLKKKKKRLVSGSSVGPEFKPQYHKK